MKSLILSTAALALIAAPAFAAEPVDDTTGVVTITGSVNARCNFTTATDSIPLGELADTVDGIYNLAADGETATLTAWCNGAASTIAVSSSAIVLQGAHTTPTGFTDTINYTATASVTPADAGSPVTVSDSTTGAADPAAAVGLFSSDITVTLSSSSTASAKLIAGDYEGSVTVTLAPAA